MRTESEAVSAPSIAKAASLHGRSRVLPAMDSRVAKGAAPSGWDDAASV